MILDLRRFVERERPYWEELNQLLARLELSGRGELTLEDARRLHYLHQRAASDLARVATFSGEEGLYRELEEVVARAHAEVHAPRGKIRIGFSAWHWLAVTFPTTFRKNLGYFSVSASLMALGAIFGTLALILDPTSKEVLMPFSHLMEDPAERVAEEERTKDEQDRMEAAFAGQLMVHNTRVSIFALALGATYGVGTTVLLFYNGAAIGAVCADYIQAGETEFLIGWLLPHGSIEIPAILIAGQGGLLFAATLIGGRERLRLRERMRRRGPELATLICGVALMLMWAGLVEAFLSQLHEPALPYALKIAFGCLSLAGLVAYLGFAGRRAEKVQESLR
jgi:uncharacterized membrane protein SpoIIM required for sporulation